jgi:hypothetical protein
MEITLFIKVKRSISMKKKYATFQIVLGICAALGWWGIFYPELTLTPDTYEIVGGDGIESPYGADLYYDILGAGKNRIYFKSKLITTVEAIVHETGK